MGNNANGTRACTAAAPRDQARLIPFPTFDSIAKSIWAGSVVLGIALHPQYAAAADNAMRVTAASGALSAPRGGPVRIRKETRSSVAADHHPADFGLVHASRDAHHIADWVVDSADNLGLPFVILDKVAAMLFVFDGAGHMRGAAPALVGAATGDDTVPGIGDREYADMPFETRTTPAGRFVAALGRDSNGVDVLWVDYEAAVAIHRVITTKPEERRLERLATPTPLDNRISYGCINVPARFYETVVSPAFSGTDGIVYVLPETRPAREVFGSYDVAGKLGRHHIGPTKALK